MRLRTLVAKLFEIIRKIYLQKLRYLSTKRKNEREYNNKIFI